MKKTRMATVVALLAISASALADATADFNALLDEHWEATLRNSPVMA